MIFSHPKTCAILRDSSGGSLMTESSSSASLRLENAQSSATFTPLRTSFISVPLDSLGD